MERKIGEIFEYNGEWYQCIIGHCNQCGFDEECSFNEAGTCKFIGNSYCAYRIDKKLACFKKLEKVGEPYSDYCPSGRVIYFQKYKCYQKPIYTGDIVYWADDIHISLEIKQTKEEMEEKKQKLDDLVGLYTSAKITYKEFDEKLKTLYADKEECKEFDLEAAKSGKPVCTRDGRKARIICFDRKGGTPIVGLIQEDGFETVATFTESGLCLINGAYNLMMLPEKKEGWVNVYKNQIHDTPESAEEGHKGITDYIKTIRVEREE